MNKLVSYAVSASRFFTLPASATCLLLLGGLVLFGWISQIPASISLNISKAGTNAVVSWKQSGVVLQSATNLAGGWSDLSTASNSYLVQTTNAAQFFRLRQTSSTLVTDIEPAYLGTSGGTFYIIGTHFSPGSVVLLNGAPAGSAMFVNSNLLMVTAGAFDPGTYNVSIVNAGQTNAVLANGLTVNATGTRDEVPPGLEFVHVSGLLDENIYDGAKCALIDLNISSGIGPDFILARTYRSKLGPTNSPVGRNWDFSCNISVATNGADVVIHDGGGRADTFFRQPDGTYTRPEFFREGQFSNQVFTLTFADKGRWVFNALNAGTAPGKIASDIDRNGNALTYAYNGAGQLASVADALNRTNRFFYNGSGQLTNVTDFAGRTVTYTYDVHGDLHSMTTPAITGTPNGNNFPNGKTVTYLYTSGFADDRLNHNLTAIIDNTGETVVTNQYSTSTNPAAVDFDRMVASALGTNPPTVFSYEPQTPSPGNRYATTKVYENDPVGNVTTALFDSRNRPVQTRQLTGRATPGVAVSAVGNQPTGKLRASDPAYFETTIAYNLDSLPVQITEPRSNSVALVYAGDANPATPVRERGNLLTRTQTPAPGVPSDQAQRVESWTYQPGFGTSEGGMLMTRHASLVLGAKANKVAKYVIRHTDPRGNVSTATYDSAGNCLSLQPPGLATGHNFEYNAAGQLTAHVAPADANARRQRDTFSYYGSGAQQGYLQSAVTDANGLALTTSYAYDPVGNCTNVVDARGNDSQFVYNQLNQLMQAKSAPGAGGVRTATSLTYSSQNGGLSYFGVVGGNVLIDSDTFDGAYSSSGGGGGYYEVDYGDYLSNWKSYRVIRKDVSNLDSDGNPIGDGQLSTRYGYDAIGRLTSVTNEVSDASSTVTQYAYDANGQVTSVLSPLAVSGADAFNTVATRYDERGLPFQQTAAPGSPAQTTTQYAYDANANLAAISEGLEGTPRITTVVADGFSSIDDHRDNYNYDSRQCIDFYAVSLNGGGTGPITASGPSGSADLASGVDWRRFIVVSISAGGDARAMAGGGGGSPSLGSSMDNNTLVTSLTSVVSVTLQVDTLNLMGGGGTGPITSDTEMSAANPSALFRGRFMSMLSASTVPKTKLSLLGESGTSSPLSPSNGKFKPSINKDTIIPLWNDELSRPATITDPLGNTTTFHYDASGNCSSVRQDGEVNDVPGSAGNVKLAEAAYHYDALGRLTSQTNLLLDADGQTTGSVTARAAFADNGTATAVTDALGHVTTVAYDFAGRVSSVTDGKSNNVAYAYDANGNVTAVTNRLKSDLGNADLVLAQSFGYDKLNRCTNATDSAGNTVSSAYDSLGRVVKTTDARGIVSQYQYDGLSRLTVSGRDLTGNGSAFDGGDIVTTNIYDANSRLVAQTDPNGNTTSYFYDSIDSALRINECFQSLSRPTSCGRLIQTTLPDGTANHFTYDVHGNVATATDANGTVVSYTYDSNNRLQSKTITPALGVATSTTFEQFSYDGLSRLVRAANNISTNAFTYDSLSRLLTETQNGLTVTNTYDAAGNRLSIAYPGGRKLGYTYDADNLGTSVTLLADASGDTLGVRTTNYYVGGKLEGIGRRNGTTTAISYAGGVGVAGAPGDVNWGGVSQIVHSAGMSTLEQIDNKCFVTASVMHFKTTRTRSGLVTITTNILDAAERLTNTVVFTNSVLARSTTYYLDKAGNRQFVSGDNHPGIYTLDATKPEPADAQVNQYSTTPVGGFTYDKNGNRIAETSGATTLRTYSYDYDNHLVAVNNGSTGAPIAGYGYDALGRRILKATPSGATYNTTRYVYDGDGVIEERDGSGTVIALIDRQADTAKNKLLRALDASLVVLRHNGTNYWPHTEADGSTVALTLDNGTVAERYNYADYGEPAFFDGSGNVITGSAVGNPYLFEGIEYDSESGFYLCEKGPTGKIGEASVKVHNDFYFRGGNRRNGYYNLGTGDSRGISMHDTRYDPRTETTLQRGVGATSKVVQTRSAGKSSGSDGLRLD